MLNAMVELLLVILLAVECLTLLGIGSVMSVNAIFSTASSRGVAFAIIAGALVVFAVAWLYPDLVAVVLGVISILTLLGMGAMMAIGAVFAQRPLVTSFPAEQERAFAAFERRAQSTNTTSWLVGLASAGVFLIAVLVIYIKVPPEHKDMTKGMNMSNLTKRSVEAPKPPAEAAPKAEAPAAAPAAEPKADSPAEAPKQ